MIIDVPYAADDYSQEACTARRAWIREKHPVDAVAQAAQLALQFRNKHEWCQKGKNKGNCLLAADELTRCLEAHHIYVTSVQFGTYNGQAHAWLEVWDKHSQRYAIVDPTADQFGDDIPEVVVGFMDDARRAVFCSDRLDWRQLIP
jgi:hypothetical protein